jgi:hypothetical protein
MCVGLVAESHIRRSHIRLQMNSTFFFSRFSSRFYINITYSTDVFVLSLNKNIYLYIFLFWWEKKKNMFNIRPPHATAIFCCVET